MKKAILFFTAIWCITLSSFATIHVINVTDNVFTPSSLTVNLGDTVRWAWLTGTGNHTTTSTTIPSGATTWNWDINSDFYSRTYIPTIAGTYNYRCNMHPTTMTGSFTVVVNNSVKPVVLEDNILSLFPSPANESVHITVSGPGRQVVIILTGMDGKEIMRNEYLGKKEIDINLQFMPNGLYFIHAILADKVYTKKVVVSH